MGVEQQRRIGRPPKCGACGNCPRCAHAAYVRQWNVTRTPEQRRAIQSKKRVVDKRRVADQPAEARGRDRARLRVWRAVRAGLISKMPCERCGAESVQAHHEDYDQPLSVVWLCPMHHATRHRERAAEAGVQEIAF